MVKLFGDGEVVRSVDVEPTVVEPVAANDAPLVVVEPVVVAPSSVEPVVVTPVVVAAYTGPVDPDQELVVVRHAAAVFPCGPAPGHAERGIRGVERGIRGIRAVVGRRASRC